MDVAPDRGYLCSDDLGFLLDDGCPLQRLLLHYLHLLLELACLLRLLGLGDVELKVVHAGDVPGPVPLDRLVAVALANFLLIHLVLANEVKVRLVAAEGQ